MTILIGEGEKMKKLYMETYGCQMNVHDSEKAVSALSKLGYDITSQPEDADLILLNTCMVREKAARKVFSRIGELSLESWVVLLRQKLIDFLRRARMYD
jgi:tRNA A37 methylthiotransferase MiaB